VTAFPLTTPRHATMSALTTILILTTAANAVYGAYKNWSCAATKLFWRVGRELGTALTYPAPGLALDLGPVTGQSQTGV
jgi:hypothetical protein